MPILTFFMMQFIGLGLIWLAGGVSQALGCVLDYKGGLRLPLSLPASRVRRVW